MYITSTTALPLGAALFTVPLFMGEHAQTITIFTGIGLGVIILGIKPYRALIVTGLAVYRFIPTLIAATKKDL